MGLTIVNEIRSEGNALDLGRTVRVKDNVVDTTTGLWLLWVSLWEDDDIIASATVPVRDLEDATLQAAAQGFAAGYRL